ncbi:alpha/beta hydrolase-fold protein [uncultured Microscilla sp.]|uniref:alpha/beta hydrolase n=1 Tax=uncultured Microscilla sp. TaxID=432653 RepID=UPI00262AFCB0|nr:alpha/beta hydrolase-fold protein [uncultured Microscilla sp.]
MKTVILWFVALLFLAMTSHPLQAQNHMDKRYNKAKKLMPFALIEETDSKELDEKRILNIYLPQGYNSESADSYPTIYVLDGSADEDFPHIAGLAQFMQMYNLLPKSIVVGIANVDRYRDFTHPTLYQKYKKRIPTCGGSAKFMAFVENEVLPLINTQYKTNGHHTIIGQSLGGLVATEFLLKKPHLFNNYIIVSPSLWWDEESLVKEAAEYFKTQAALKKKIFISLGKEHKTMHKVANQLTEAIRQSGNKHLTLFYEPILTEDHTTILHKAVYRAFELLYPK